MLDQLTTYQKLLLLVKLKGSGGGGTLKTLTGNLPLTVSDALNHALASLTRYGLCTQDGTPTPDAPVDIMTNNGAIKYGTLGSNLYDPSTAVFEVGYYYNPNADGAQTAAQNNFIYHAYIPIEAGEAYVFYGRQKETNRISQYNRIHWYDESKTYIGTNSYTAGAIGKGVAPDNAVYAKLSCNPQGANTGITEETVLNYNWTFCKGTAEVTPFVPFGGGIYPDGTPETLTITHNLYDANGVDPNHYYDANGVYTETQTTQLSNRVPVKRGDVIVCKTTTAGTGQSVNIRYNQLDTSGEWVSQEVQSQARNTTLTKTVTINQDGFFCFSGTMTGTTYINFDATVISIESETQTVTVPMLLGIGNYKDEAELIQGIKTGKIGVKVFDGTETFTVSSSGAMITAIPDVAIGAENTPMNTHFALETSPTAIALGKQRFGASGTKIYSANYYMKHTSITTDADFKAWLAAQYAAGTPVIVLYPLATETTEQTTPQHLVTHKGTNVVDSTANVTPVEAELQYYGTASASLLGDTQNSPQDTEDA